MRNTGPHKFEMEQWVSCAPFEKLLNIEIVKAERGEAILKMPFLKDFAQGAGLMHGGAIVALADTAAVMAIKSILPKGTHFATTKLETEFLYPVKKGYIECFAKVNRQKDNDRIFLAHADVVDENKRKVMQFDSIFKIAKNSIIKNIKFKE